MATSARSRGTSDSKPSDRGAEPTHPFRPVMASKAALEVADQMTFAILSGRYEVGDRLPIILELSKAMNVSPPVVGEAIRLLSDAGVLDVRRGNNGGIIVRSADIPLEVTKLSRPFRAMSLRSIVEARRPIEIAVARLAAVRATKEDLDDLEKTNSRLVRARGAPRPWTEAHNAFHYTMGRAARSEMLAHFQHEMLEELALMLDNFDDRFMEPEFEELAERFDARNPSTGTPRSPRRPPARSTRRVRHPPASRRD